MTEMQTRTAERIAAHGREALLDLLRPAFARHAARAEYVEIDRARLERLVQEAAERADGVLWRRALAQVGTVELRISLGEAVTHPAVLRAHELVGAPPYEPGAAQGPGPVPAADPVPAPAPASASAQVPASASAQAPALASAQAPRTTESAPTQPGGSRSEPPSESRSDSPEPPSESRSDSPTSALRMAAVHLSGIETVRAGERNIELRFSDAGLDVLNHDSGATIGRLTWDEIQALELPRSRRRLRPGRRAAPELVVRTERGQATFELPGLTEQELREHLAPMFARTQSG